MASIPPSLELQNPDLLRIDVFAASQEAEGRKRVIFPAARDNAPATIAGRTLAWGLPNDASTTTQFNHDPIAHVADPDAIAGLVESDPSNAESVLWLSLLPKMTNTLDWPDMLAGDLRRNPSLKLWRWAAGHGLAIGSVGRDFAQVYGVSPATFRLQPRTHRAIRPIMTTAASLATVAQNCGFADQAHMAGDLCAMRPD